MLHLFAVTRTPADERVADLKQNLCVAENVNDGVSTGLSRFRILLSVVIERQNAINTLQTEQQTAIELLNHELTTMETQASTTRSLITSMEQALLAIETHFKRRIFSQIQDQENVDHM